MKKWYFTIWMYSVLLPCVVGCLYWYDWKLLLLFFCFIWANNIDLYIKENYK